MKGAEKKRREKGPKMKIGRATPGMSESLAKLAAQQEALRRELQKQEHK